MITASDLFRVSVRQVIRQRTYGVIFSIALGITAFITLAVLGQEIRYNISQDMLLMGGVNVIQVYLDDKNYPGQPPREFYPNTIKAVREIPGISSVSVNVHTAAYFMQKVGERNMWVAFNGVDELYGYTYATSVVVGRDLNADDISKHRRVCVMGKDAAVGYFGSPEAALGQLIFLKDEVFEVVGVVTGIMLGSMSQDCFLPYTVLTDRSWGDGKVKRLLIRATAWEDIDGIVKAVPQVVQARQVAPYIVIRTQSEQLERIQKTFVWVEALLWLGIVAALMLGGFGIWYGTFAAVRARTREVGLKKAMGGSNTDILAQFLMEALCKSVAGGIVGIIVGVTAVEICAFFLNCRVDYLLLMLSSLGSIAFSAVIGIVGGYYPAIQASRMDVVTALRFE